MKKAYFAIALWLMFFTHAAFANNLARTIRNVEAGSLQPQQKEYLNKSLKANARPKISRIVSSKKAVPVASRNTKDVGGTFFDVMDKAKRGDVNAQFEVGRRYAEGDGTELNYTKAAEWYQKAAMRKHVMAQNNLGDLYREGKGVKQDFGKAREWYEKAAARNNEYALYNLGMMYENGEGVRPDLTKAREYYEKAAAHGHEDAKAAIAKLDNPQQAAYQPQNSPSNSSRQSSSRANTRANKPSSSSSGKTAPSASKSTQNVEGTFFDVMDKAKRGDVNAQFEVGRRYAEGDGTELNYTKAAEWYQKAAMRKHAMAQNNLGNLYRDGNGVRQDSKKAIEWYEKAAARNNEYALYNLGMMYEFGDGVYQDMGKAREYYQKAAAHGSEDAKEALANIDGSQSAPTQPKLANKPSNLEVEVTPAKPAKTPQKSTKPAKTPQKSATPAKTPQKPTTTPATPAKTPEKAAEPAPKPSTRDDSRPKPRLAVREFEDRSEDGKAPADAITDMMITELKKTDEFTVMLRGKRFDEYIGKEITMGQSGLVDTKTAPAVGKLKGLQYTMAGSITLYYYTEKGSGVALPILGMATEAKTAYVVIDLMIIDNSTGEIIYANNQYGEAKQVAKGAGASYKGFFVGGYSRRAGGLLQEATRNAVIKHVSAIMALEL